MRRDYGYYVHVQHAGCWSQLDSTNVVKVDLGASRMLTNNASTTSVTLDSVISNKSYKAATTGPPVPSM